VATRWLYPPESSAASAFFYPNKKPSHTDAPFVFVVDDGKQRAKDISRLHF